MSQIEGIAPEAGLDYRFNEAHRLGLVTPWRQQDWQRSTKRIALCGTHQIGRGADDRNGRALAGCSLFSVANYDPDSGPPGRRSGSEARIHATLLSYRIECPRFRRAFWCCSGLESALYQEGFARIEV